MIYGIKRLSFGRLGFTNRADTMVFDDYDAVSVHNSNYKISMKDYPGTECFDIFVKAADDKTLGGSSFVIDKASKKLNYVTMGVQFESNKHKGIGTVLHLSHIIEMIENGLKSIEFYSTKEAVLFHSKLGFRPDIKEFSELDAILSFIEKNEAVYTKKFLLKVKDLRKSIMIERKQDSVQNFSFYKNLVNRLVNIENDTDKEQIKLDKKSKELLKKGNNIISKYIDISIEHSLKDNAFLHGFSMILSRKKVLANKNFYNKLFENFKIDYRL